MKKEEAVVPFLFFFSQQTTNKNKERKKERRKERRKKEDKISTMVPVPVPVPKEEEDESCSSPNYKKIIIIYTCMWLLTAHLPAQRELSVSISPRTDLLPYINFQCNC